MVFAAGQRVRAADLNRLGQLTGRNARTTNFATAVTTTETAFLSVRAAITAGRSYKVTLRTEAYWATASTASEVKLRYTTNDIEPTISATQLDRIEIPPGAATGIPVGGVTVSIFDATTTGWLRVLATLIRTSGTGSVSIGASSGGPTTLMVEDIGDGLSTSGTVY